jgi:hypothetical protein
MLYGGTIEYLNMVCNIDFIKFLFLSSDGVAEATGSNQNIRL